MTTTPAVDRLSPEQIEARLAQAPVAYLPLGTLEFHGPHLPVGLDALTAHGICLGAAESAMSVVARTLGQAPAPPVVPDHAGRFESLVLHALDPDLVHVDRLPDPETHPAPSGEDPYGATRHDPAHPLYGVFGADPRRLDVDAATPLLDHLVRWTASLGAAG